MAYEEGMLIMFDVVTKAVFVEFRNEFTTLTGPYSNRFSGISAGEAYCRHLGWDGTATRSSSNDNLTDDQLTSEEQQRDNEG